MATMAPAQADSKQQQDQQKNPQTADSELPKGVSRMPKGERLPEGVTRLPGKGNAANAKGAQPDIARATPDSGVRHVELDPSLQKALQINPGQDISPSAGKLPTLPSKGVSLNAADEKAAPQNAQGEQRVNAGAKQDQAQQGQAQMDPMEEREFLLGQLTAELKFTEFTLGEMKKDIGRLDQDLKDLRENPQEGIDVDALQKERDQISKELEKGTKSYQKMKGVLDQANEEDRQAAAPETKPEVEARQKIEIRRGVEVRPAERVGNGNPEAAEFEPVGKAGSDLGRP